jgi:hypothetical protein
MQVTCSRACLASHALPAKTVYLSRFVLATSLASGFSHVIFSSLYHVGPPAPIKDENGRKRYLFGNQFFGRFSLIANK